MEKREKAYREKEKRKKRRVEFMIFRGHRVKNEKKTISNSVMGDRGGGGGDVVR